MHAANYMMIVPIATGGTAVLAYLWRTSERHFGGRRMRRSLRLAVRRELGLRPASAGRGSEQGMA